MARGAAGSGWRAHVSPLDWGALLSVTAVVEAAQLLVLGIVLSDLETLAFGVVVAATTAVLFVRRNRLALLVRCAVFADVEYWMLPAAITNLGQHAGAGAVAPPLMLVTASTLGLAATVVSLSPARRQNTFVPRRLAVAALAGFTLLTVYAAVSSRPPGTARAADAVISVKNARYSATTLRVKAGAGRRFTVQFTNNDLFWHTFTSPDLGVDERLPLRSHRAISITARPGVYRFYCAIPGHAQIGMRGTITVS